LTDPCRRYQASRHGQHGCLVTHLSGNFGIRRLRISVPLVPCLVNGQKYHLPDTLPPLTGNDLQRVYRPRVRRRGYHLDLQSAGRLYTKQQISAFYRVLNGP
jgi:hypothetical protein